MPEQAEISAPETQVQTPVVAKVGKIERVTMTFPQDNGGTQNNEPNIEEKDNTDKEGADATKDAKNGAATETTSTAPAPTINDEILREYFEKQGIKYEGVEKLKEKLTAPAQNVADTPEQIKAKELAQEKRRLDKFISGGGTAEQYVALKSVAEADVAELSKNTLIKELKDAKFTDTEIDAIIKERYYQIDDEELEQLDDETDKAFKKRSKEYYANKLANRSLPIKNQAVSILQGIQDAINSEDLQAQQEVAFSAKIDEDFKVLPRKLSIEIGEIGGKTVLPVNYDVSETDIAEIKSLLKDPVQRQQLLFNQDGSLNINRITQALIKEKAFDSAAKISYLEAQTRNNELWQKTFPARSAQELGVGGSPNRNNGQNGTKVAGVGKVQRVQPQRQ